MLLTNYSSPDPTERLIAIEGVVGTTSDFLPASVFCVGGLVKKKKKKETNILRMICFDSLMGHFTFHDSFPVSRVILRLTFNESFLSFSVTFYVAHLTSEKTVFWSI